MVTRVVSLQRDCTKPEEQNSVTIMNGPLNSYTYPMWPLMSAALVPCTIIVYSNRYRTSSTTDRAQYLRYSTHCFCEIFIPFQFLETHVLTDEVIFMREYFRYNLLTFERKKNLNLLPSSNFYVDFQSLEF